MLLLPFTLALVIYWARTEPRAFPAAGLLADALLVFAGPITAVPLALFASGARRIRLSTLGFLQYFTPTFTLLLATLGFHEHFGRIDAISFAFVWVALLIVALEGRFRPALAAQEGG
jgi:chloramphenicol-sensitive protein RarD